MSAIEDCQSVLKSAHSLFVLTGAGISAESGIPTFRGKDGLWKNFSAYDLATPEAFQRNPELVWEWYHWRQSIILKARPNRAHLAITELEAIFEKFLLLTQNVDNLHQRAGTKNILEIHGNIFRARCLECNKIINHQIESEGEIDNLPRCECGGLLRPDVVWFGEPIDQDVWQSACCFLEQADVALICGTSGVVWPVAGIPEFARQRRIKTIEVNLEPTPISNIVDISIPGKAGEVLPRIVEGLK